MAPETSVQAGRGFDNTFRAWMGVAATATVLVAAVLATVVINIGWASTGQEATYKLTAVDFGGAQVAYGELGGEASGRGLITTSYITGIIGLALGFLAVPILMAGTLMEGGVLRIVGASTTGLGAVCLVLTAVLGPVGISRFHDDVLGAAGDSLSWGTGFILAIIAGVFAVVATVTALLSLRPARAEA